MMYAICFNVASSEINFLFLCVPYGVRMVFVWCSYANSFPQMIQAHSSHGEIVPDHRAVVEVFHIRHQLARRSM